MRIENSERGGVSFLRLLNDVGLEITLSDFGAGLYEARYDGLPLTIAEKEKASWLHSSAYFGKTIGRLAGRIPNAKLAYLGKVYPLEANEGVNTLHGGKNGFSEKLFKMDVNHLRDGITVDFYLTSVAKEGGFPGEVSLRVRYFLAKSEPFFRITYAMKSSEQTPLNLTAHTYFNLGGEPTVENQTLWIKAKECESYDPALIPLGFIPVPPCLDFQEGKPIGRDLADPYLQNSRTKGYDHAFRFADNNGKEPVLRLESERLSMEIITSLPAVQVYSYNYPVEGMLSNNRPSCPHAGVAIEPVFLPNDFRAMTVLPFETKKETIEYRFRKKGE